MTKTAYGTKHANRNRKEKLLAVAKKKKQQPKNGAFFGLNTQIYVITEILN